MFGEMIACSHHPMHFKTTLHQKCVVLHNWMGICLRHTKFKVFPIEINNLIPNDINCNLICD